MSSDTGSAYSTPSSDSRANLSERTPPHVVMQAGRPNEAGGLGNSSGYHLRPRPEPTIQSDPTLSDLELSTSSDEDQPQPVATAATSTQSPAVNSTPPARPANDFSVRQLAHIRQDLDAVSAAVSQMQPQIDLVVEQTSMHGYDPAVLSDQVDRMLHSTATQSIIANAISRGVGATISSAIVTAIYKSFMLPFDAASSVATTINEGASAVRNATKAVDDVAETVSKVRNEIKGSVADLSSGLGVLRENVSNVSGTLREMRNRPAPAALTDVIAPPPDHADHQAQLRRRRLRETIFGDNSVTFVDAADAPLYSTQLPSTPDNPNFWQCSVRNAHSWADSFVTNATHDWIIQSENAWYDGAGEQQHQHMFQLTALAGTINLAVAHHLTPPRVKAAPSIRVSQLAEVAIADYKLGGQINDRTVQNTLNGMLHVANMAALRDVAFKLGEPVFFYDNTMLYAKLMHYVLLRRAFDWAGTLPQPTPWHSDVHYVNLDADELGWHQLADPIDKGDVVLVDQFDWHNNGVVDIQLLHILSSDTPRMTLDAGAHGPIARECIWPQIPITVLMHGQAPAMPAVAVLDAATVLNFARQLASSRNEHDQLLKGLQCAVEILGCNVQQMQENVVEKYTLSPFHGVSDFHLPRPRDYNYLARFLNLRPPPAAQYVHDELDAFATRSNVETVTAMALYTAALQAMTTTYLAGLNITTGQIIARSTAPPQPMNRNLLNILDALDTPTSTATIASCDSDAKLHVAVRRAACHYFEFNIHHSLWWQQHAMLRPRGHDDASLQATFHNFNANTAPRRGTMFALTSFVRTYPYEWGCSTRGAHFDISKEVLRQGPVAARGWISVLGDVKYNAALTSLAPFQLHMYGWQVMQCLCNRAWQAVQPAGLGLMTHAWQPSLVPSAWNQVAMVAAHNPLWNDNAHCYEPCTFKSFNWDNDVMFAPRLQLAQAWWHPFSRHDGARPTAGFDALGRDPGAIGPAEEGVMDFSFLSLIAGPVAAAPRPQPTLDFDTVWT